MTDAELKTAIEILPDRLYYVSLRTKPEENNKTAHFFTMEGELVYWNFFLDFGPLNLAQLYRFCQRMNAKLKSEALRDKIIYYYCGSHAHRRANAAFLMAAWAVLYLDRTPEEAWRPFRGVYPPFPSFHDASPCVCTFNLTIVDCLKGLAKARYYKFFDFSEFNVEEYEHYEQVENGDLNWIVDGKFIAFAGPHNSRDLSPEGYYTLTPEDYTPYFLKHNVQLVVRLNKKYYEEARFKESGINHMELYYLDGSIPTNRILMTFLEAAENTPGAIAVHCKAGLGRTGTCIGCYIMKHYRFTAAEAIGWIRICRPGSIIGPQQHYMKEMEQTLWHQGDVYRQQQLSLRRDVFSGASATTTLMRAKSTEAGEDNAKLSGMGLTRVTQELKTIKVVSADAAQARNLTPRVLELGRTRSQDLNNNNHSSSSSSSSSSSGKVRATGAPTGAGSLSSTPSTSTAASPIQSVTQGDCLLSRRYQLSVEHRRQHPILTPGRK